MRTHTHHCSYLQSLEDGEIPEGMDRHQFISKLCDMGHGRRLWSVRAAALTKHTGESCWVAYQCFLSKQEAEEWTASNPQSGGLEIVTGY